MASKHMSKKGLGGGSTHGPEVTGEKLHRCGLLAGRGHNRVV